MSKFKILGRFVSKADEAAQALKREKGTGEEFLREIQKTPGVKAAEIKDRKLDKVLPTMGKTTKAEVLKKLEQNPPPKIEETILTNDFKNRKNVSWDFAAEDLGFNPAERNLMSADEIASIDNHLQSLRQNGGLMQLNVSGESRYGKYQIPGGENYREILLRLPKGDVMAAKQRLTAFQQSMREKYDVPLAWKAKATPEEIAEGNRLFAEVQEAERVYHSSHWEEPNVLAHARVSDRVGPNGEKILHVEEIQSDWHQAGRKQGYQDPNILEQKAKAEAARKAAQSVLDEAQEKVRAAKTNTQRYEGIINDPRFPTFPAEYQTSIKTLLDRYTKVWMDELPNLMKAQKEFDALPDPATMKTAGVPDAPFKKNWHELTMKRILDYAADKGYDKIAITPGAEQAKRYDLSKQIGKLEYDFGPADTVGHLKAYGLDGGRVIDRTVKPEELADYIGKEAAEKLIKTPAVNNTHMLEGVDLQVGGEGMKGFYDQILPTYLNDLGKPYGVKVGQMEVSYTPTAKQAQQGAADEALLSDLGVEVPQAPRPVLHTFDITPQMREEIKAKGLPLYQVGAPIGAGAAAQQALPTEEPEGPPVPVQFTDNPDVMQLELAGGGAVKALKALVKGEKKAAVPVDIPRVRPTQQDIIEAAERVGRQQLGEHVTNPLTAPANLAGRAVKEAKRLKDIEYKLKPAKPLPKEEVYQPKIGEVNIALPGDQTIADMILESIGDVEIGSLQQGGAKYGLGRLSDPEAYRAFWASNQGAAQNFQNKVDEIARQFDTDQVTAQHLAMGLTSNDFAQHFADANIRAIDYSKMNKRQMEIFDSHIAAGYTKKNPKTGEKEQISFPEWPGISNPEAALEAMKNNSELRKWFNNRMKTQDLTTATNMPDGRAIQWAITEPLIRNSEINLTGLSVGRMKPGAELIPNAPHETYSHDIAGTALGRAPELAPFEISFPDVTSFVREKYRPQDFTGTIQKVFPHQIVDEAYLEDMQKYYEQLRKVRGFKDGGKVKKTKISNNPDTMRLELMRKGQ